MIAAARVGMPFCTVSCTTLSTAAVCSLALLLSPWAWRATRAPLDRGGVAHSNARRDDVRKPAPAVWPSSAPVIGMVRGGRRGDLVSTELEPRREITPS